MRMGGEWQDEDGRGVGGRRWEGKYVIGKQLQFLLDKQKMADASVRFLRNTEALKPKGRLVMQQS